jgi:hypothetical protein
LSDKDENDGLGAGHGVNRMIHRDITSLLKTLKIIPTPGMIFLMYVRGLWASLFACFNLISSCSSH